MSNPPVPAVTDAASPFTMVTGDPAAMLCDGEVCIVPGLSGVHAADGGATRAAETRSATPGR